ncbi:hypothetical protein LguiA_030152 [Lonicera macranthoides]
MPRGEGFVCVSASRGGPDASMPREEDYLCECTSRRGLQCVDASRRGLPCVNASRRGLGVCKCLEKRAWRVCLEKRASVWICASGRGLWCRYMPRGEGLVCVCLDKRATVHGCVPREEGFMNGCLEKRALVYECVPREEGLEASGRGLREWVPRKEGFVNGCLRKRTLVSLGERASWMGASKRGPRCMSVCLRKRASKPWGEGFVNGCLGKRASVYVCVPREEGLLNECVPREEGLVFVEASGRGLREWVPREEDFGKPRGEGFVDGCLGKRASVYECVPQEEGFVGISLLLSCFSWEMYRGKSQRGDLDVNFYDGGVMQGEGFRLPPIWQDLAIYPRGGYVQESFDILPGYVSVLVTRYTSGAYLAKESGKFDLGTNYLDKAIDLLISVLVCSKLYKPKIIDLAVGVTEETIKMATEQ